MRLLLDLDQVKVNSIARTGDFTKQAKVQDLLLGLVRLAIRKTSLSLPDETCLSLCYPNHGGSSDIYFFPSEDALKAVLDLDFNVEYSENGDGENMYYSITPSSLAAWKAHLAL
jgi:hypothetical protein